MEDIMTPIKLGLGWGFLFSIIVVMFVIALDNVKGVGKNSGS